MTLRKRYHPSGRFTWQVDVGIVNGKRLQLTFKTKQEAEDELFRRKNELRRTGQLGANLTDEDRLSYASAKEQLAAVGATLDDAVKFFLKHARPEKGEITFEAMLAACLEAKWEEGYRPRYLVQLKSAPTSFARAGHALRPAHEISSGDVERWLKSNQWAPKTWNGYLGDLRTVFQWGLDMGYVTLNPCAGVARRKLHDGEIGFLTTDQAFALLERAAAVRPGAVRRDAKGVWIKYELEDEDFRDCLAFVVLGLFCGLRPERELGLMEWSDVKGDVVVVSGHRAKSRSRRIVDLPENAREWLKLCPRREGKILPKNFTRKWRRLRAACELRKDWPHDVVRHTFATMHLAHFKDEKKLQVLMGHVSADLIYKHYRGQATPAEAAKFWALRPRLWGKSLLLVD